MSQNIGLISSYYLYILDRAGRPSMLGSSRALSLEEKVPHLVCTLNSFYRISYQLTYKLAGKWVFQVRFFNIEPFDNTGCGCRRNQDTVQFVKFKRHDNKLLLLVCAAGFLLLLHHSSPIQLLSNSTRSRKGYFWHFFY